MNEIFKKKHREKTPKHTLKVIHVERIWQREEGVGHPKSACGPAAAAMVVKYLSRKGFVTFDSMKNTELVNVLYRKIGTFPWGTTAGRLKRKLRFILNRWAIEGKWDVETTPAKKRFYAYCSSIDDELPVIILFPLNFSRNAYSSHHFVVGIGYKVENSHRYLAVLDPDGGKHNDKVHWIKWEENEPYMKFVFLKRFNVPDRRCTFFKKKLR